LDGGRSRYQFWLAAREHCKGLTKGAVYQFLKGERPVESRYLDAMLIAAGGPPTTVWIKLQMKKLRWTRFDLWRAAMEYEPSISKTAVYRFLEGKRSLGLWYIEAMIQAMEDWLVNPST
jgi:hypothetical protein